MTKPHPLKRWRAEKGVTLVQLGERVGLTDAFLCMVENRDRGVSMQTAVKLRKITGLPLDAFVREEV